MILTVAIYLVSEVTFPASVLWFMGIILQRRSLDVQSLGSYISSLMCLLHHLVFAPLQLTGGQAVLQEATESRDPMARRSVSNGPSPSQVPVTAGR